MNKNEKEMETIRKKLERNKHMVLKRNKLVASKSKGFISFFKTLDPESAALAILSLVISLGGVIHKKSLVKLLKESFEPEMWREMEPLLEDLDDGPNLKLSDLLEEVGSVSDWGVSS